MTTNLVQHTFRHRCGRDLALELVVLRLDALSVDIRRTARLQQRVLNGGLQFVDGRGQRPHLGRNLTGRLQQLVAVLYQFIVIVDELCRGGIRDTDVGRDDLITVARAVDILPEVIDDLHLGVRLRQLCRELT